MNNLARIRGGVGDSIHRADAVRKVTGQTKFGTDLKIPGMLYGRIFRSQRAHARIVNIDTSAAAALPGVRAVLVGADLDDIDPFYGVAVKDQPILALDVVRYYGDPVAAVAADDPETAGRALDLIEVQYEDLPGVHSLDEALAPGAPLVHESVRMAAHFRDLANIRSVPGTNICHHYEYRLGDAAAGFELADRVFDAVYEVPAVAHCALEPYVVIAEAEGDRIVVTSATQHPFLVRKELAEIFGLPQTRVEVSVPPIGGAYGSKCYTKLEPLAVCLARKAARPVKLITSVEEAFHTVTRHGARVRLKTGVRRDGMLVSREVQIHLDTGAYADVGPRVANKAGFRVIGPYRVPNLKIDSYAVYTHNIPAGAYRGYGAPQGTWAVETQMDEIADWLGMDALEFRLKNLRRRGDDYVPGDTPIDGEIRCSLEGAAHAVQWSGTASETGRGKGLACAIKDGGGSHSVSQAAVRVHADGSAGVHIGSVEMGQGSHTTLAQIVVQELRLPAERVVVAPVNTSVTPYDQGTSASRTATLMGEAVQKAARHARDQIAAIAGDMLGCSADVIRFDDGFVAGPDRKLSIAEVIERHFGMPGGEIIGMGSFLPRPLPNNKGSAVPYWEIGAGAASVAVDLETCEITVLGYASAADVGTPLNPAVVEGQDEGAAMQGLGHVLFEALQYENGQLLNGNFVEYRVPSFEELPDQFTSVLIEARDGPGPHGVKGVGESGVISAAPAVANAVFRAVGVRLRRLPLTPESIWRARQCSGQDIGKS